MTGSNDLQNLSLFEQLCDVNNLRMGFMAVKRNKGAHGIDNITIEMFAKQLEEELTQLSKELKDWSYQPMPVRRVEIPKPGKNAGVRLLGIPTIRDRVVQTTLKQLLEPIYEPLFSPNSYGFRPNRSAEQAVHAALAIVKSGKEIVVDIDLEKFFDKVSHDRLINRLSLQISDTRILRLIGMTLRSGIMINGIKHQSEEGTTQGSPLSPLLSNVVLDELDKELENRKLQFCRFADDCNNFVASEKAGRRVMESITNFIEHKLKLKVNQSKSQVAHSSKVKFLGMTIIKDKIAISKKSMQRAFDKIRTLTKRGTSTNLVKTLETIKSWYLGWANYHKMTNYPIQLQFLEAHIRRRLRSRIVSQKKSKRVLVNNLIKRKVSRNQALRTVYSHYKKWGLSNTNAMHKAYSNKWFAKQGLVEFSSRKLEHWLEVRERIKLT